MTSTASSTAGTPEEQPINEHALTEPNAELSAPENTTDRVETEAPAEAPTRVYLHPEQLAMIQTPEALPIPVLQRSMLRVSYVPAIMPGKWFNRWHERYGDRVQLAEVPVREARGLDSLHQDLCLIDPALESAAEGENAAEAPAEATDHAPVPVVEVPENPFAHMSIVRPDREPASTDGEKYHSIRLYEELPVVILPVDHVLTVLDEVPVEELAEEFLLQPASDIPAYEEVSRAWRESAGRIVPEGLTDKETIELVAAGVGLYIVPMSIARFYHRKDLTYRPVAGLDTYPVHLVWPRAPKGEPRSEELEALLQDFIGIVRGRTATSDRGSETRQARAERIAAEKAKEKAKARAANARREARDKKRANAKKNGNARQHARQSAKAASARRGKKR
ncbi:LysR substrate-binding domain-containing protein [Rothia sp. (in: high G+C Gram-positive bacteria)]|uniref:LysR substrate-binding domain-containing protein n=1 Tax=Rothia sp. (in: high G+C Gram-positive bacteria) TaxID=1885016 RepID=UPI001CAF2116|nr:LysR substrate-binding domain-containing protein [Rothia sp. (in: high G+C Gram-positive bacteria)]MBF1654999.1 transcriptional regulator [Rothia sp. (in: high G+C Gram-positive bacteria)]